MSQPLNKVGRELLVDLINRTNQLTRPLTLSDIQFSPVTALTVTGGERNSQVTVYPAPGSNYIRSKTVTYWRLDMAVLLSGELRDIGITEDTIINNTNDIIDILNDRYGLLLTPEDVVYENISLGTLPSTITLTMAPGSYAYIGSVPLTFAYDLSQIIQVNVLDGLEYPQDAVIENVSPFYVTEEGNLLTGSGLTGSRMITGNNVEAEGFIGIHRTGPGNAFVDPVGNTFTIPLADNRHWSVTFGVGLIEQNRGSVLTDLYDVTFQMVHESGVIVAAYLEQLGNSLVWSVEGVGPAIIDNAPTDSLLVAQNSQRTVFYAPFFPGVPQNGVGAHLGTFTFTLVLTPKNAIYIKPIEVVVVANIIPE